MAEFFDMYCETADSTKKLGEFDYFQLSDRSSLSDNIGVDWLESWRNDQGKEIIIECCFDVESSKKASNLVGALLLGLKTHKNFPKYSVYCIDGTECSEKGQGLPEEDWSKLTKDFHHFSTKVKYLSFY